MERKKMKNIIMILFLLPLFLSAQPRELIPISKTEFLYINKKGEEKEIDMTGKDFILVSVREEDSDGRFYAVDRDGTAWLSGGISSGLESKYTPSGVWHVLYKKRYYTSKKYPEEDGSNNMDYSIFFTKWGHALHEGHIDYMSHGCIHVKTEDIRRLFKWAHKGMPVLVTRHRYMDYVRPDLKRIYSKRRRK